MRIKTGKSAVIVIASAFLTVAGALAQQGMNTSAADRRFAREACIGGMEEVQLGQIAVKNAQSDKVKQFGQRMIDDHTKAGDQLKQIASKNNLTLPNEVDAKGKALIDRMSRLNGAAFDKAYMRDMVKDHESDVAAFQKEADGGSNADLKSFAGQTLPTLQDHLRMAKEDNNAVMSMK
jgi:putative membrane protein